MLHSYLHIEDSLNIDDVVLVIITNDINCLIHYSLWMTGSYIGVK